MEVEEFKVPPYPETLFRANAESGFFVVQKDLEEIVAMSKAEILETLENILSQLEINAASFSEHDTFDIVFPLVLRYPSLSRDCKPILVDVLIDGLNSLLSSIKSFRLDLEGEERSETEEETSVLKKTYCNTIKMFVYSIQQLVAVTEKKLKAASKEESDDTELLPLEKLFGVLVALLDENIHRLWPMSIAEPEFLALFPKICSAVLENAAYFKGGKNKHLKSFIGKVIGCLSEKYGEASNVATRLFHLLCNTDHMCQVLSFMIETFTQEYKAGHLLEELLKEIGQMGVMKSSDKKLQDNSFRNVSTFLVDLSQKCPQLIIPHLIALLPGVEHESYTVRNAIIQVIGHLLSQDEACRSAIHDPEILNNMREEMTDTLLEHIHDVHAFSRSKVLQTVGTLVTTKTLPQSCLLSLTEKVVGRLRDKSANVRKNAIVLLVTILKYNPYGFSLAPVDLKRLAKEGEVEKIREKKSKKSKGKGKEGDEMEDGSEDKEEDKEEEDKEEEEEEEEDEDEEEEEKSIFVQALSFVDLLEGAFPLVFELLNSKNATDILESIEFLVTANTFSLPSAPTGIKKLLVLIWSKEQAVKDRVSLAFQRLYLTNSSSAQSPTQRMTDALFYAKSVIDLTENVSLAETLALEELFSEIIKSGNVDLSALVEVLFEIFIGRVQKATVSQRQASLLVLSMVCGANIPYMKKKIDLLLKHGLLQFPEEGPHIPRYSLMVLQKCALFDDSSSNGTGKRMSSSNRLFSTITDFVLDNSLPEEVWYTTTETAMNVLFTLSENPDRHASKLICGFAGDIFPGFAPEAGDMSDNEPEEEKSDDEMDGTSKEKKKRVAKKTYGQMSKLMFLLGHTVLRQLVHLDDIQQEIRRRRDLSNSKPKRGRANRSAEGIDELDMISSASTDEADEDLKEKLSEDLVRTGLLGSFAPVVVHICQRLDQYPHPNLCANALLALCKYMCCSSKFCSLHLKLLFQILESNPSPTLRGNIAIAVGDLAFRFPNLLAPWTAYLFNRLKDEATQVRKNALMVLTHLILNGMIKGKGQISQIALCTQDSNQKIADLATLFFIELSQKGNEVYNAMPDMISGLSVCCKNSEEIFQKIMRFLFGFINHERQKESLVDKLCHRFPAANEAVESHNLAYCLSLMDYSERTLRKLIDLFSLYKDRLTDDVVSGYFQKIISKTKKSAKPEVKNALENFEDSMLKGGEDGDENDESMMNMSLLGKRGGAKKKAAAPKKSTVSFFFFFFFSFLFFSFLFFSFLFFSFLSFPSNS